VADTYNSYIQGKSKNDLLRGLNADSWTNSPIYEQQRMAIFVRCTEDLEIAVQNFTDTNNKLSKQILILNVIFGVFTMVGAFLGAYQIFCK
jgi:hypothetical protein